MKDWTSGIGVLEDDVLRKTFRKDLESALKPNRREASRVSDLSVAVTYRPKGKLFPWKEAKALDFSRKGIRIVLDGPIDIGTRLDLSLKLPGTEKTLNLDGVIVWVNAHSNGRTLSECGVAFIDPKQAERKNRLVYYMADKFCQFALTCTNDLICRPVQSQEELKGVYRLLYKEYLARGYCAPNLTGMHYNFYCGLPDSCTFVLKLKENDQLVGTVSLFGDSPAGLPLDSLFPEQLGRLRRPGRRLAEVGLLALDHDAMKKRSFSLTDFGKLSSLFRLFREMFDYARFTLNTTDLVIGVHPKHETLYRYLTFNALAEVRSYEGACGNPALPMRMDVPKTVETVSAAHGKGSYFLRSEAPKEAAARFAWDAKNAREFVVDAPSVWSKMTDEQRAHFNSCYSGLATPALAPWKGQTRRAPELPSYVLDAFIDPIPELGGA